ncbi:Uncharacterized membrane protein YhaH, DUF805 family [Tindallia magadiensis]|uniref:Uncharacterized membrane protein YhaH, DUF805 family n=1 Tax=Tindallia magadiensis TaxID=69895 RepID=A0A1I3CW32_9FIRM|nr:DUF805 domain-containing protein [Tindallia magadiensis]SFH78489.1 Uncharacterized membrane protein YhaH, DUF805 family [Tindallia magadiensis]
MNRLLQFDGRATRSEYWCFAIIHNMIKAFVTMIEFSWYGIGSPPLPAYFTISGELSLGYAVLAFIPCLAITIRRFHDIGASGAFLFYYIFLLLDLCCF